MKLKHVIVIIILVIFVDQVLKIWIKTGFETGDTHVTGSISWFRLHFIENPGMAWGMKFGNEAGKLVLTLFRLAAVIFGSWYLVRIVKQGYTKGFIICASLIFAGALGNLLDSMFYGMIFDKGLHYDEGIKDYISYAGVASFSKSGYSNFLHGSVVDMLHFPLINSRFPSWVPFVGGDDFEFFSPIFNIADASISVGVITMLVFQKRFFRKIPTANSDSTIVTSTEITDTAHIS